MKNKPNLTFHWSEMEQRYKFDLIPEKDRGQFIAVLTPIQDVLEAHIRDAVRRLYALANADEEERVFSGVDLHTLELLQRRIQEEIDKRVCR